jgi:hypothetical protein
MTTERSPRTLLLAGLALTVAWLPAAIVAAPQRTEPAARVAAVAAHHHSHHATLVVSDRGEVTRVQ